MACLDLPRRLLGDGAVGKEITLVRVEVIFLRIFENGGNVTLAFFGNLALLNALFQHGQNFVLNFFGLCERAGVGASPRFPSVNRHAWGRAIANLGNLLHRLALLH